MVGSTPSAAPKPGKDQGWRAKQWSGGQSGRVAIGPGARRPKPAPAGRDQATMSVPGYKVGRIIGKGGSTIKEITSSTQARVDVEKAPKGTEVVQVTLRGTTEQIARAKRMIQNLIEA